MLRKVVEDRKLLEEGQKQRLEVLAQRITEEGYMGAKPYFLINEQLDARRWMTNLIQLTASELSASKPKKSKTKKTNP